MLLVIAVPFVSILYDKVFRNQHNTERTKNGKYEYAATEKTTLEKSLISSESILCNIEQAIEDKNTDTILKNIGDFRSEIDTAKTELTKEFESNKAILEKNSLTEGIGRINAYESEISSKFDSINSSIDEIVQELRQTNDNNTDYELIKEKWTVISDTYQPEMMYMATGDALNTSNNDIQPSAPDTSVNYIPSYVTGAENASVTEDDYELSNENDITKGCCSDEVTELAETLKNPIDIYNYVRNNIDFEPYDGSRKGAVGTFAEKAGNDTDQASLLIGLLRYNGYAARYVTGNIEVPIENVMTWTGAANKEAAIKIMGSLGIKITSVKMGDEIISAIIEHTWTEVNIPYQYYRGLDTTAGESMWIPLDPSYKHYEKIETVDLNELFGVSEDELEILDWYEKDYSLNGNWSTNIVNPDYEEIVDGIQENAEDYINKYNEEHPENPLSKEELVGGKKIVEEELELLPNVLPYTVINVISEAATLDSEERERISFTMEGAQAFSLDFDDTKSFEVSYDAYELYGKRITVEWVPASETDSQIIKQYGGIDKTPVYMIMLKPTLKVEGETVAIGSEVNAGYRQKFIMDIQHVGISGEIIENPLITGGIYSVVLDYGNISATCMNYGKEQLEALKENLDEETLYTDETLGKILHSIGVMYFTQLDQYDKITANGLDISRTRLLSEGIVGYTPKVSYVFQTPVEFSSGTFNIDVDYNALSVKSYSNDKEKETLFVMQSGIYSSAMEHTIFEQVLGLPSVSTIKILTEANNRGIPIYNISSENADAIEELNVSASVKADVADAVNSGKVVCIPKETMNFVDWCGSGYMVIDTSTGAAAYMISGGMAGGSTAMDVAITAVAVIDLIFAIVDLVMIWGAMMAATGPIGFIIYYAFYLLTIYTILDTIYSYFMYMQSGDIQYANSLLIDLVINLATLEIVNLLKKFAPDIDEAIKNLVKKLSQTDTAAKELGEEIAEAVVEKSGKEALGEAEKLVKGLRESNVPEELIENAAKKNGKEGIEQLAKACDNIGAETAEKLVRQGFDPSDLNKLFEKGIGPDDFADFGIKNADDADKVVRYLEDGKSTDEVKELMKGSGVRGQTKYDNINIDELKINNPIKLDDIIKDIRINGGSPVEIPNEATVNAKSMNKGYQQIKYQWSDGTYKYEARWHTETPGAAQYGRGTTWVVTKTIPGNAQGQKRITEYLVGNNWISENVWKAAERANMTGHATAEQMKILEEGHWLAK